MEKKQYWTEFSSKDSYDTRATRYWQFELRAEFAWRLLSHFGVVAGVTDGEDRTGRAKIELLAPTKVVKRCFDLADAFVDMAESRNELKEVYTGR